MLITYLILQLIGIVLVIFSSICESVMDTLQFHYERSVFLKKQNQKFWNPNISWKNKYKKDLKTPKFIGSTTIFVFTTDAWHLYKFFRNLLIFIGLPLIAFTAINVFNLILAIFLARVLFGLFFTHYLYKYSNKPGLLQIFKQYIKNFVKK